MVRAVAAGPNGWASVAMIASVLAFAGLSVGAYLVLFRGDRRRTARHTAARQRLAEQFARGQIDAREYRELAAALDQSRPAPWRKPGARARASRRP